MPAPKKKADTSKSGGDSKGKETKSGGTSVKGEPSLSSRIRHCSFLFFSATHSLRKARQSDGGDRKGEQSKVSFQNLPVDCFQLKAGMKFSEVAAQVSLKILSVSQHQIATF